jgi:hypothetical protein
VFTREAIASVVQQDYQLGAVEGLAIDDGYTGLNCCEAAVGLRRQRLGCPTRTRTRSLYRFWLRASVDWLQFYRAYERMSTKGPVAVADDENCCLVKQQKIQ